MNLQEYHDSFFERPSSELGFSSQAIKLQEINSSRSTHLIYTNLSTGETLEGPFYLEKNLLVYQTEELKLPKVILDLSYVRLYTIMSASSKIYLDKNQNTHEIMFHDKTDYDDWMLKLRNSCVLTNFEKKYEIAEEVKLSRDRCECLLVAKMGGNHYSARKFDKKHITEPENYFEMIRLINKIEILRTLRKKRVLNLLEVHETEDSIYLVTECGHNETLKKVLKTASYPFSVAKVKTTMYQLLKTLAYMTSKNIVHRNLKPSSILVEEKDQIRINNFCLATYIDGPKANVGVCGTPGYIAPEILNCHDENRVFDDKVDVFSAGCIFFEMLFGYPLFKGAEASEIFDSNKNFKYSDLIQLVVKEQRRPKPHSTKLGLDLLLKLLHNDQKQRISAEEALRDVYFDSQDSSPPKQLSVDESDSTPKSYKGSNSPQNCREKSSFDVSSNASFSLRGSFSDRVSHHEKSTLCPSNTSFARLPRENSGRCLLPSSFKNQPKFKTAEELKLNDKISSEIFILQKLNFTAQNEEDFNDSCDESSPLSLSKNCPLQSPVIRKNPN